MERFGELALGAHELYVQIKQGDISVRVDEAAGWTLEWSGSGVEPQVQRDGTAIRIRQQGGSPGAVVLSAAARGRARGQGGNLGALAEEIATEAIRGLGEVLGGSLDL